MTEKESLNEGLEDQVSQIMNQINLLLASKIAPI